MKYIFCFILVMSGLYLIWTFNTGEILIAGIALMLIGGVALVLFWPKNPRPMTHDEFLTYLKNSNKKK